MATHYNILAWRISWKEEPGRLQSTGSQRVRHDSATSLSLSFIFNKLITLHFKPYIYVMINKSKKKSWSWKEKVAKVEQVCVCIHMCMKVKVKSLTRVRLFATPWTVAYQAPLSMRFFRQVYWNRLLCPPQGPMTTHILGGYPGNFTFCPHF